MLKNNHDFCRLVIQNPSGILSNNDQFVLLREKKKTQISLILKNLLYKFLAMKYWKIITIFVNHTKKNLANAVNHSLEKIANFIKVLFEKNHELCQLWKIL